MQRAYERQLSLIEEAINIERDAMIDHNNKRWEALYRQRDREEIAHMESKFEQVQLQLINFVNIELYNRNNIIRG